MGPSISCAVGFCHCARARCSGQGPCRVTCEKALEAPRSCIKMFKFQSLAHFAVRFRSRMSSSSSRNRSNNSRNCAKKPPVRTRRENGPEAGVQYILKHMSAIHVSGSPHRLHLRCQVSQPALDGPHPVQPPLGDLQETSRHRTQATTNTVPDQHLPCHRAIPNSSVALHRHMLPQRRQCMMVHAQTDTE